MLKAVGEDGGGPGKASDAAALVRRLRGPLTQRAAEARLLLDGCTGPSPSALMSSPASAPSSATGADPAAADPAAAAAAGPPPCNPVAGILPRRPRPVDVTT